MYFLRFTNGVLWSSWTEAGLVSSNPKEQALVSSSGSYGFLRWFSNKESTCNTGDLGLIPGSERSPAEGKDTHSNILAWKIPWTEEPGGLQSMGCKELDKTEWWTGFQGFILRLQKGKELGGRRGALVESHQELRFTSNSGLLSRVWACWEASSIASWSPCRWLSHSKAIARQWYLGFT